MSLESYLGQVIAGIAVCVKRTTTASAASESRFGDTQCQQLEASLTAGLFGNLAIMSML